MPTKRFTNLMVIVFLFITGCTNGSKEIALTETDNGSQVTVQTGQIVTITLKSNPTTGFLWEVVEINEDVLSQTKDVEYIPESLNPLPGQGGAERFEFEAVGSGETSLILIYHRPWEEGVEPIGVFEILVIVE